MKLSPRTRRWILITLAITTTIVVAVLARPAFHLARALWNDSDRLEPLPPGYVDDASRLNATKVEEVWSIPADPAAAERQLAELLARAKREGLGVSIGGARHSMGGHTIYPGGISVDMLPFNRLELNEERNILRAGAGARWAEIVPYLDARGRSVAVMQSNNSFSVGGSISVNCHGWQFNRPPIASTVESLRLMRADGTIVKCSRNENAELFSLVLGGYGLFGIILDVELRVVSNQRLRLVQHVVSLEEAVETFDRVVREHPDLSLAYGRMNIVPDTLFDEVIINVLVPDKGGEPPKLLAKEAGSLRRAVFRGSAESDYGKELRWEAETKLQPYLSSKVFSRNQLLNEGVEVFQNRSADTTDILHEYFVPRAEVANFVQRLRIIVRERKPNLLNVTIRSVNEDPDTFLRYADQQIFAFVMLYNQPRTPAGEEQMEKTTRLMIDAALASGGRYYLPYRLHAAPEQFERAYPMAREFFALKLKYDPAELFRNGFYEKYGRRE
jgi:FAD/FMN-containing dehydrogenase